MRDLAFIPSRGIPAKEPTTKQSPGLESDFARGVAETLVRHIAIAIARLPTADKNRVLLSVAAFIATQLEALEANNDA